MKLAIADPPYLGRAEMWYGERQTSAFNFGRGNGQARKADHHPDAATWDDPETHHHLVRQLVADYDGWAIAMLPDNLHAYIPWVPRDTRIAVWHTHSMPTGAHPRRRWEAVLVSRCPGRRRVTDVPIAVGDVLTYTHTGSHAPGQFAGRKPRQWTEWVLAMLGYCPTHDTVDDLFHGSGAVSATLAQGRLIECKCGGDGQ